MTQKEKIGRAVRKLMTTPPSGAARTAWDALETAIAEADEGTGWVDGAYPNFLRDVKEFSKAYQEMMHAYMEIGW